MASYSTMTVWKSGHLGELRCGNGAVVPFSAPARLHGVEGVLTPEDAFVGALNSCYMLMFLWSCERLKIELVSYTCEAEGFVEEYLDKTSAFERVILRPKIEVKNASKETANRALDLAKKYSLVWQSIRAEILLEPEIKIKS